MLFTKKILNFDWNLFITLFGHFYFFYLQLIISEKMIELFLLINILLIS